MLLTDSIKHFLLELYHDFFDTHCTRLAASLSYTTLLTLVPFLMITFWILSLFSIFSNVGDSLQHLIINSFVTGLSERVTDQLYAFLNQLHALRWTNLVSFFVASVLLMYNLVRAYNFIWQEQVQRSLAMSFLIYAAVLIAFPIVFSILVLLGPYLMSLSFLFGGQFLTPLSQFAPHLFAFFSFTLFNWILPAAKVKFRYALLSGFITAVLFETAKFGFAWYLKRVTVYHVIYGALATIPVFLVWMYVTWLVVLLGVVLCKQLNEIS